MQTSAPPDSGPGTTFKVAITIVLVIGLAEVVAIIWGLANRQRTATIAPPIESPEPATPVAPTPGLLVSPPPPTPATTVPGAAITGRFLPIAPPVFRQPTTPARNPGGELLLPENQRIHDPIILESIADGIRLREDGDAHGALTQFRTAADITGEHPVILAELGRTYEIMGLDNKAIDCWERIYRMGEAGAGDYFVIADVRLRGLDPQTDPASASRRLRFDHIAEERRKDTDPGSDNGETILLRIPIRSSGGDPIVASEVSVYVYFYDQVNGHRIEQSTADPPQSAWRTLPVDWLSADPEIFEIVYHHPSLSPEEIRALGERSYFGYVLKLYYQDRLQDIIAAPRLLLDYAPATTAPQINDILFR